MALDDATRQKLQQLRDEFAKLAEADRRAQQLAWNAEQTANKKAKGGRVSASSRADGIAQRGKTKGRFV